jgi:MEDS: MEthanogen/methylotroph, DcmR Sensory domain
MAIGPVARRVGIEGKNNVQWGEHLCTFFNTRIDLLNLVVPYIKAGLEDNEFCLWITDENMAQQAMEALQQVLPDAPQHMGDAWQCLTLRDRGGAA